MKTTTFSKFLKNCATRDNAVGDFARDWLKDGSPRKPQPSKGINQIIQYLESRNACPGCLEAAKAAWHEWRPQG